MATLPPPVPRRGARVSAVVLLAVVAAAFVWGLAMFALGRGLPDPAPVVARDAAQATLNAIDQALAAPDWDGAERLIAAAHLPEGASWAAALGLRRDQLAAARAAPPRREFLQLSPHATRSGDWLAVAKDVQGVVLLHSTDGGGHWGEVQRLSGPAGILRAVSAGDRVLVTRPDAERVGWTSSDGGTTWRALAWPAPPGAHGADAHFGLAGDGRVLVAVHGLTGHELQVAAVDGTWTLVGGGLEVLAIATLEREALVLARAQDDARTWRVSTDSGHTFTDAPTEMQALAGHPVGGAPAGEELRLTFADGRCARFARKDGAFIAVGP